MISRNDFNLYRIELYRNDFVSKRPNSNDGSDRVHVTINTCIENIRIYLLYLPNPALSFEAILRETKKFTGMTFVCAIKIKNKTLTHTSLIAVMDWSLL